MSAFFFCHSCGHNLTYITDRRLKCYGCGKYFTENFICRCSRKKEFRYSAEVLAPNKAKCLCCGKEAAVSCTLEAPYRDKYRGSGGTQASDDFSVKPFKKASTGKKLPFSERTIPQVDFQPDIFNEQDRFLIVGELPFHQRLDQIRWEIKNGILIIQSLLSGIDLERRFILPEDVMLETCAVNFRNAILEVSFQKKKDRVYHD